MKNIVYAFVLTVLPLSAFADGLSSEAHVTENLVAARVADKIRKNCDGIDARMFRAIQRAYQLKDWALEKGYSEEEIESFLEDKTEKERIYGLSDSYLAVAGLEEKGWCVVGEREIMLNTAAGSLLKK